MFRQFVTEGNHRKVDYTQQHSLQRRRTSLDARLKALNTTFSDPICKVGEEPVNYKSPVENILATERLKLIHKMTKRDGL